MLPSAKGEIFEDICTILRKFPIQITSLDEKDFKK